MLFTGDTLIKDIRTVTKLKTGSRDKLKETLSMLEKLKGMGLMVYPGHEEQFLLDSYNLDNSLGMVLLPIKSA
jgi:glyoxylase-like metal-dependent hydrolase (beta-lactamase superfamily II)